MHGGSLTFLLRMLDCPQLIAEIWCRVYNEHLLVTSMVGRGGVVDVGDLLVETNLKLANDAAERRPVGRTDQANKNQYQ